MEIISVSVLVTRIRSLSGKDNTLRSSFYKGFFLFSIELFYRILSALGISRRIIFLRVYHSHWKASSRIFSSCSCIVFFDSFFQIICIPCIVCIIRAEKDVYIVFLHRLSAFFWCMDEWYEDKTNNHEEEPCKYLLYPYRMPDEFLPRVYPNSSVCCYILCYPDKKCYQWESKCQIHRVGTLSRCIVYPSPTECDEYE